jgi:hypothetical protein
MNFTIEGARVLSDFNPGQTIEGERHKPVIRQFDVEVKDADGMRIDMSKGSGDEAFISAIEIISKAGAITSVHPSDMLRPNHQLRVAIAGRMVRISGAGVRAADIVSIDGSVVHTFPNAVSGNELYWDASLAPAGTYFIRLKEPKGRRTEKVFIR